MQESISIWVVIGNVVGAAIIVVLQYVNGQKIKEVHSAVNSQAQNIREVTAESAKKNEALAVNNAKKEVENDYSNEINAYRQQINILINASDDAIITKNLDGIITSWNMGAEDLFGYKSVDVVGKNINILLPEDRPSEESDIVEQIEKGHSVISRDSIRLTKSGEKIHVRLSVYPIHDIKGTIVGAIKIARLVQRMCKDVTK